jgi:phosphohistidine phosphatase
LAKESKATKSGTRLRVLVVRHAIAEDREEFAKRSQGESDGARPLTRDGRRKFDQGAKGIVSQVPKLDALATSPLTRAIETAEILAAHYKGLKPVRLSALAPGKAPGLTMEWLREQPTGRTVAVVGHEPHLGEFVSWCLSGLRESFVELKKGAAVLLDFGGEIKPGRARLIWALKPSHLRALGGKCE